METENVPLPSPPPDYGGLTGVFDPLTVLKAKRILEKGGVGAGLTGKSFKPCGLVLYAASSAADVDAGEVCVIDRGVVRWLTVADHRTLMHPSPDVQCKGMKLGYLPKDTPDADANPATVSVPVSATVPVTPENVPQPLPTPPPPDYTQLTALVYGLVRRLRGIYVIPVDDGGGLLHGKDTYTRTFETAPIQHEAAAMLESLLGKVVRAGDLHLPRA
jgi:hypothetical protein